jgi:DNA-binding transcriptional MocR family regulator
MTSSAPQPIPYYLMEKIRRGIITGRYAPGEALREQQLESEYGTSRGPLREALRLLQLRGLVTHEPRRGFRVREYSPELTMQIYRLRGLLERHSIEALAGKPLDDLVVALRAAMTASNCRRNSLGRGSGLTISVSAPDRAIASCWSLSRSTKAEISTTAIWPSSGLCRIRRPTSIPSSLPGIRISTTAISGS